jgi:hypothetical protein
MLLRIDVKGSSQWAASLRTHVYAPDNGAPEPKFIKGVKAGSVVFAGNRLRRGVAERRRGLQ